MTYVNGSVFAVAENDKQKFIEFSERMAVVFKENGALSQADCWGVDVPEGEVTSFPKAVDRNDGEVVVFSWITWPSKEFADAAWEKVMADPRMSAEAEHMPFDGRRMIFGGFEMIAEA
ncbi:DUF1428 domain-containing protein [uncultured Nitratireductor sp.]|uniref:DUF1428 domain-containing protein n=1 Tax=uncultured Nitratireductor sp. TaxID=520953 RepID=UPI0025F0A11B|nr:DUF1428 domain-containing protein [uncultured Nitratireductor sp.]